MQIELTETGASAMRQIMADREAGDDAVIRLEIAGGGCSGIQHQMDMQTNYDPEADEMCEQHGIKFVASKKMSLFLAGTQIDAIETPGGPRFAITNPNVPKTGCAGCGG